MIGILFPEPKPTWPYVKEILGHEIYTIDQSGAEVVFSLSSQEELIMKIKELISKGYLFERQDDYKSGGWGAGFELEDMQKKGIFKEPFTAFHKDYNNNKYIKYQIPQNNKSETYEINSVVEIKRFKTFSGTDVPFFLFGLTNGNTLLLTGKDIDLCKKQSIFPSTNMKIIWQMYPLLTLEIICSGKKIKKKEVLNLKNVTDINQLDFEPYKTFQQPIDQVIKDLMNTTEKIAEYLSKLN